jgi:hypothetical protein
MRGTMADLIDFPSYPASPDDLPQPGDAYRAFAPPAAHTHLMLMFVFPDGLIEGFKFSTLERIDFIPAASPHGVERLRMLFRVSPPVEVWIEGRNLWDLHYHLGQHQTRWLRMLAEEQGINGTDTPAITSITINPPGERAGAA